MNTNNSAEHNNIVKQAILREEMSAASLDYSLSVIISRALPDARDGLKPVQRRILYAMKKAGYDWSKPYKKSAGTVGDTLKNYHPHGNASVYDAMVRMAQPFSLRVPLIDGQGNFGSLDGDPPAAERYTEARLDIAAKFLLHEDDMDAVPYEQNYDNSTLIAKMLPARFPNLLVNGASGIAVGMATNIPPHNLNEILNACSFLLDNPDATTEELVDIVPAPDFPLGGQIFDGKGGILEGYKTGRGSFSLRGEYTIDESNLKPLIIITTIPYQVNKAKLVENIADLIKSDEINDIHDLRDESNEEGIRIVVELKKGSSAQVVINKLLNKTQLQVNVHFNMLAVMDQKPMQLGLKEMLDIFLNFREEVIINRTLALLEYHKNQAHKLWGMALAIKDIDKIIECIKNAADPVSAEADLQSIKWNMEDAVGFLERLHENYDKTANFYHFSQEQAKAILDLKLQRLTKLEFNKLDQEVLILAEKIASLLKILNNRSIRIQLMKDEFEQVKKTIGSPRRTYITTESGSINYEDLIEDEQMVIMLSMSGYIKRMSVDLYRTQQRGGKGKNSAQLHEDDTANLILTATNLQQLLFFSNFGKVYTAKVYELPQANAVAKGKAIVNILALDYQKGEKITSITKINPVAIDKQFIVFVTESGKVRRNAIESFSRVPVNGKRALSEEEVLVNAMLVNNQDDLLLATENGKAIRFPIEQLRVMQSRDSSGVIGMNLKANDRVVSALKIGSTIQEDLITFDFDDTQTPETSKNNNDSGNKARYVLTISVNGYGKKTSIDEYRQANRGGMGVSTMDVTKKTGKVLKVIEVRGDDQIMLLTSKSQLIRINTMDIRITSRATQGVMLVRLDKGDSLINASLC